MKPLKAEEWNRIAARDKEIRSKDRLFGSRDEREFPKYTDIRVANIGEVDLKAHCICGIYGLLTDEEGNVNPDNLLFQGGIFDSEMEEEIEQYFTDDKLPYDIIRELIRTYSAHQYRRIGITREPIPAGTVGRVAIDGEAFAWVEKARNYDNGKDYPDPKPFYSWYLTGSIKTETRRQLYTLPSYFPFYGAKHNRQELYLFSEVGNYEEYQVDNYTISGHVGHLKTGKYYGYTLPVVELLGFTEIETTMDNTAVTLARVRFRSSQESYMQSLLVNNGILSDK